MSVNESNPHKSSENTSEPPENNYEAPTHFIDYTPRTHGVDIFFQLRDNNGLYDALADLQHRLTDENRDRGQKNHPHYVGDMSPSGTPGEGEYYVDFYSSSTGIGHLNEKGEFAITEDIELTDSYKLISQIALSKVDEQ